MVEHTGPRIGELQSIVERLSADLERAGGDRSVLLQIEISLRGMLPLLEGMLQYAVVSQGESARATGAERAIMPLSQHLEWIQLHAHAPLEQMYSRVRESLRCAELALQHLSS
jgi:hypothetical protein